jgi:hypothetical protein
VPTLHASLPICAVVRGRCLYGIRRDLTGTGERDAAQLLETAERTRIDAAAAERTARLECVVLVACAVVVLLLTVAIRALKAAAEAAGEMPAADSADPAAVADDPAAERLEDTEAYRAFPSVCGRHRAHGGRDRCGGAGA